MIRIRWSTVEVPLIAKVIGFLLGLLMHCHHIFTPMVCQMVEFRIRTIMIDAAIIVWRLTFAAIIFRCKVIRIGTSIHIDRIATISRCIQIIHIVTNFTIQNHFFHLDRRKIVSFSLFKYVISSQITSDSNFLFLVRLFALRFFPFVPDYAFVELRSVRVCLVLSSFSVFARNFLSNAKCIVSLYVCVGMCLSLSVVFVSNYYAVVCV